MDIMHYPSSITWASDTSTLTQTPSPALTPWVQWNSKTYLRLSITIKRTRYSLIMVLPWSWDYQLDDGRHLVGNLNLFKFVICVLCVQECIFVRLCVYVSTHVLAIFDNFHLRIYHTYNTKMLLLLCLVFLWYMYFLYLRT